MTKKKIIMRLSLSSVISILVILFAVHGASVLAQGFIGPSAEAPGGNVLDFLSESSSAQGRLGKLRVGSNVIPSDPADPYLDVMGNTVVQGNATISQQGSSPALFVSTSTIPTFVSSGTKTVNGKYTIQGVGGSGLYAASASDDGIFVLSMSAGTQTIPVKAIFGQTVQVGTGAISTGVLGVASSDAGAGIFGQQANCTGSNIEICGYAAQFIGNVVVTGEIQGDGRGVFKTWTLKDASGGSVGSGIAVKTVDVTIEDFNANDLAEFPGLLSSTERFISMSIMVNGQPYDSARVDLEPTNPNYLDVSFDANPEEQQLAVARSANSGTSEIAVVVMIFYEQRLSVDITNNEGLATIQNALLNSDRQYTFTGSIGGAGLSGGEFVWTLHTDPAEGSPVCTDCGTILIATGQSTVYTPPVGMPASGNRVYLRATWTSDSSLFGTQTIDLYGLEFQNNPINNFVLIGNRSFDFEAVSDCPGFCTVSYSLVSSNYGETINETTGQYVSPASMSVGSSWSATVRATLSGLDGNLYRDYSFQLLPDIVITATNIGQATGLPNTWTSGAEVGTGQTLTLVAEAQGIPSLVSHDFVWQLVEVPLTGESLYNSIGIPLNTNDTDQDIGYTAPTNPLMTNITQYRRFVRATWMSNGQATASSKTIDIFSGRGPTSQVTLSRTASQSGTFNSNFIVSGFNAERRIYSFCTTADCSNEQVVNYDSGLPLNLTASGLVTCGTLLFNGMTTVDSCNPELSSCTLNAGFTYTGAAAACSNTIRVKLMGDTREYQNLKVETTTGTSTCFCKLGTEPCCGTGGGSSSTGGLF